LSYFAIHAHKPILDLPFGFTARADTRVGYNFLDALFFWL
jgi:hypothetical protein